MFCCKPASRYAQYCYHGLYISLPPSGANYVLHFQVLLSPVYDCQHDITCDTDKL